MLKGKVPNCAANEIVIISQKYVMILYLGIHRFANKGWSQSIKNKAK
jgi:hypothetical protein